MFRRHFIFLAIPLLFTSAGGPAFAQPVDTNTKAKTETSQPELSKENAAILETCFKCHGKGGVSQIPTHPTIAGQKAGYLVKQLNEFKRAQETLSEKIPVQPEKQEEEKNSVLSGRSDFIMSHMAADFNKNNFTTLAVYISSLPCDGVASPNDEVDQGEKTPTPPSVVGRCVACHGENGISSQPSVPNLAGQRRAYLRRELLLMRETAWGGNNTDKKEWRTHPIMEQQAARLKIEDVDSIANYYAQLNCREK